MIRYVLIRDVETGGARVEADGEVIWESENGWSYPSDEIAEAILDDANFGNPQREAIKAVIGVIDTVYEGER